MYRSCGGLGTSRRNHPRGRNGLALVPRLVWSGTPFAACIEGRLTLRPSVHNHLWHHTS